MNELKFIKNFKTFVDEINKSNSRNYKLATLEKYKNNDCVKYFLQQIYDPYLLFGISDKKLHKNVGHQSGTIWLDYPEDSVIFDYLKTHSTGTDIDIWTVQQYKNSQICDDCKELFDKIVTKNLQLGVSTKSINDIFGKDTIKEFKVQLAEKFFDQKENFLEGKEFAITTKIDGMRCVMIKENGKVTFWSRQGQPIDGLVDLEKEAEQWPDRIVLDGELIVKETLKEDTYKNTMKTARTKDVEKHNLKMMVFDFLDLDEFKNQTCSTPYIHRREILMQLFARDAIAPWRQPLCDKWPARFLEHTIKKNQPKFEHFELLPLLYLGADISRITEILEEQVAKGEEGIMINLTNANYEFKRTNSLLKVKKFKDCDLKIIGFEEGTNRLAGTLGAIFLDYKGNMLRCGSGFSEEQRKEIWDHKDKYLGKIAEIKYFEETKNQNGGISLRFPVFKDVRFDKTEPNY